MVVDGHSFPADVRENGAVMLVPSSAGAPFLRGDANVDGRVDVADGIRLLNSIFLPSRYPGPSTPCAAAADANDDGVVDASDAIFVLGWRFLGGIEPPEPGPWSCGEDPPGDAMDCASYDACP